MGLPPKVLVVQGVILGEKFEIIGQLFHRWKIHDINVRMRWSCSGIVVVDVHYNRDNGVVCHCVKPKNIVVYYMNSIVFITY